MSDSTRRLAILCSLSLATRYKRPTLDLKEQLDSAGHPVSTAKLGADLAFLSETGLVNLHQGQGDTVAELTCTGLEVVRGEIQMPGVSRPGPGA